MPHTKEAWEVEEGDRVLLADCMEFKVDTKEHKVIQDLVNGGEHETYIFELGDVVESTLTSAAGSLSIHKDPQDKLIVLDPDEEIPLSNWKAR